MQKFPAIREPKHHDTDSKASGAGKGAGIGAGVGAIAGLAALAIPGVGPFVAFGALAEAIGVAGSAAVTSGIVGSAAGGLSGALMHYGVDKEEAEYYSRPVAERSRRAADGRRTSKLGTRWTTQPFTPHRRLSAATFMRHIA